MLLLLLLVQLVGFGVVRQVVDRQVRAEVEAGLQVSERVWVRSVSQNAARLRDAAVVLAADFGFRSAIASADVATIASALDNAGGRIGAGVVAFLDPAFVLVAAGQAYDAPTSATLQAVAKAMSQNTQEGRLATVAGQPYLFVTVPVRAPLTVGWVLMGFPLDDTTVQDFWRLSGVHAAVLAGEAGQPLAMTVSSWPGNASAMVEAARMDPPPTSVDGVRMALRKLSLQSVSGDVRVLLMRPLDDVLAPYEQLQGWLGLITVVAVLLFAVVSRVAARRVTGPLYALTRVTKSLEAGTFDVEVPGRTRGDEVGALARSFDRMRISMDAQRQEILRLAYWDRLTGLPNREQFRQTLQQRIAESLAADETLAVITLDLDRFKHVNDVLGYAFGDELLKAVAERLKQQVFREGDLVARLGGDEFAIMLSRTDAQGAVLLTERIIKAFEVPLAFEDQTVDLSASMGVACWPDSMTSGMPMCITNSPTPCSNAAV